MSGRKCTLMVVVECVVLKVVYGICIKWKFIVLQYENYFGFWKFQMFMKYVKIEVVFENYLRKNFHLKNV